MTRFEFRPLDHWDRPHTRDRRRGQFRARWDDTVNLLLREVDRLDGHVVVVQVDAPRGQIRRDGMLYSRAQVDSPAVKISFDSRHGPLSYATDVYDWWQDNVRAVALALEALRAVDRYGITRTGEQYQGWTAITAQPAETGLTADEARRVLADAAGVTADSLRTADGIRAAYRTAAVVTHPDRGGNPDVFRLITTARDVLDGYATGDLR